MRNDELLEEFEAAALAAGRSILEFYRRNPVVKEKADHSPVTEADERAERIILQYLTKIAPDIPVIAEEEVARGNVRTIGDRFILVDALDGTREFIAQRPEFTVNIALVHEGAPVLGVVYAPAQAVAYCGSSAGAWKLGIGADFKVTERSRIFVRHAPPAPVALASRSHGSLQTQEYLQRHEITEIRRLGSSLKFCLLAEGLADLYPRFGRTMEWDTAAGDAVLRAAGGRTRTLDGAPLAYGKTARSDQPDFANPDFIASGG
ncbi:3'(2'),5'-bisphosphate nucleotidase [Pseudorhizobium endolithicum]|uniref:3'(2'),5'-bisphosphate nucleotidase CysQ n=1 Tax=Pseudorhizobium endolithicum TaxID=1191678 RepID=A0ABN7JNJ8_9HYPH|nr:3'(2'),5'-bisphosphate nucleotidase CysQ [Pseudorhizobium endolithicum]CAD7032083.1 3'(2'),5'-bisphosphate nucleotidase [Pseudorhizobium endolithicum]